MEAKPERQGLGWDAAEEQKLYDAYIAGQTIASIAKAHDRSSGGIRACLKRLGLFDEEGDPVTPVPDFLPTAAALKRAEKQEAKKYTPQAVADNTAPPELNERFQQALTLMEDTDRHLFVTGKAGTGKSTLLNYFCRTTEKQLAVVAPTGVAALNVKGQTIHSFFSFPADVTVERIRLQKIKPRSTKIYKKLKTLIIDEVSMVRADLLDCIDIFLRLYGPKSQQPFGGVQMIFVGDLWQLPPVVGQAEREIFRSFYETPYFFSAHVLQHCTVEIVELQKIYRQKDEVFVDLLNRVREATTTAEDLKIINSRVTPVVRHQDFTLTLTTTNAAADGINETELAALSGKLRRSTGTVHGDFAKEYFPTAPELMYKLGAQIMLINNDSEKRWVNGSIGVISDTKRDVDGSLYLTVDLQESGESVAVKPYTWEVYRYAVEEGTITAVPVGSFTQFPFRLAWGITIHKSQGKTFERVVIDTGRGAFAAGQIYVALSRCTTLEGITLKKPIQPRDITTDPRIRDFVDSHTPAGQEAKAKAALIREAIASGDKLELHYRRADGIEATHILQPLEVGPATYQGTRYDGMKALIDGDNKARMFQLDRILQIKRAS